MRTFMLVLAAVLGMIGLSACQEAGEAASDPVESVGTVNVYTARHYGLLEETFTRFMEETSIEVRFTAGKDGEFRDRLMAEGEFTPADMLITVDGGNLWLTAQEGLLQPVESDALLDLIPENFRDPESQWFGLSLRIRAIVYHPDRVDPEQLSSYEALADPEWGGRLCLRPASKVYTQSLVASLIAHHGHEAAAQIVAGWAQNAKEYIDSDTRIIETIEAGVCDVGIVNHYYLARKQREDPNYPVRIFWPNQQGEGVLGRGVHANISGVGITKYAHNPEEAILLLEWLAGEGQAMFAEENLEYPIHPDTTSHPVLQAWGEFKIDLLNVAEYGRYQVDALRLMEEVGYK